MFIIFCIFVKTGTYFLNYGTSERYFIFLAMVNVILNYKSVHYTLNYISAMIYVK